MSQFCERFGLLSEQDALVLEATLEKLAPRPIKFLEIGVYQGQTGLGIKKWCDKRGVALEWWGIDSGRDIDPTPPFEGAIIRKGKSEQIYPQIPNDFDAILIDGCHCRNHIILDTLNYSTKVVVGGFLLFHDTSPSAQGKDYQSDGVDSPEFYISTLEAFKMISWPHPAWELIEDRFDESLPYGGMRCYRRLL